MLKIMITVLGIMTVSPKIFSQKFLLTDINSNQYSIDKITQQVYFRDYLNGVVMKVDLGDMSVKNTGWYFLLPFFANNHHFMLYGNNSYWGDSSKDNIYLFNLDSQSYYQVTDTMGFPPYVDYGSFSPNDSFLINPGFYFSLKDSSLKPLNIAINYNINDAWPEWSSDTSFVFLAGPQPDSIIAEYFIKSGRVDTLVALPQYNTIYGFSYNRKYGILAYAVLSIPPPTPKIYFHYAGQNIPDSLIYEPVDLGGGPVLEALRWSPHNNRLAFICSRIDIGSQIYVFDSDSNKTYVATGGGYEDHLKWANNDTLIFIESQFLLYGVDVSSTHTSVKKTKEKTIPSKFTISNYPNPFNLSTRFDINLPVKHSFSIKIYNSLGRLIKTISVNPQNTKIENISWDGRNNSGLIVSSGVYFAVAETNNKIRSNTVKLILLK